MSGVSSHPPGGDENKEPAIIAVDVTAVSIALVLVCPRIYVRARIVGGVKLDDPFMVLGMVLYHRFESYSTHTETAKVDMRLAGDGVCPRRHVYEVGRQMYCISSSS